MSEDEARRYGIEEERRRRFFRVYDDKNNRAPPSDASDWFQMFSVSLDNDPQGGGGDNMGVVVPWSPPDAFEGVTPDHLLRVQREIDGKQWRESSQSSDWVGRAVAGVIGLKADADAKADRARINSLLKTWIATGALVVVEAKDEKRNIRRFVEVGTWAVQGLAPPAQGEAGQGRASEARNVPRPTSPPVGRGGVAGGAGSVSEVGQNQGEATSRPIRFPAGNPVLRPLADDDEDDPAADFYDAPRTRF
jgi:hypothetical protein